MNVNVHACLQSLLDLPGAKNVILIDHTGDCLLHLGETKLSPAKLTVWSVLARASFGAGDEMGNRSDAGSCREITNIHDQGGTLLRLVPGGRLIVVYFSTTAALGVMRIALQEVASQLDSVHIPEKLDMVKMDREMANAAREASSGAVLFEAYDAGEDPRPEETLEEVSSSSEQVPNLHHSESSF
jgi:hypothetical protein